MSKNTFEVYFRGRHVKTFTSVHDEQHLVLTYPHTKNIAPVVDRHFKTLASCVRDIKGQKRLAQWQGQTFIVRVLPGKNELTESDTFDVTGKVVL